MKVSFQYQDPKANSSWSPVSWTSDLDCQRIHEALQKLTRQFPGCHLRALDDKGQVIETLRA